MKKTLILMVAMAFTQLAVSAQTGVLPRTTASAQNVDPVAVKQWVKEITRLPDTEIHHLMVVRHGNVIAEAHPAPFAAQDLHTLYSCSKSVVSLAVGIAIDEGLLTINDRVARFFPDKLPAVVCPELDSLTVRHLLTMSSGIVPDWEITERPDWLRVWLAKPFDEQGRFRYDNMCTFTLSAILQRVTGRKLVDYVREKLFTPLGIKVFDWEESPDGINTGAWGLRLQAESLAKLGILMVNGGNWFGRRIVSEQWIREASTKQINFKFPGDKVSEVNRGYGYQLWRCICPIAFRADGAYGQYIVMVPEKDLVVVVNGIAANQYPELATIWNTLLPGVKDHDFAENTNDENEMRQTCMSTRLATAGAASGAKLNKKLLNKTLKVERNPLGYKTARLITDPADERRLTLRITKANGTVEEIVHLRDEWEIGTSAVAPPYIYDRKQDGRDLIAGISGPFTVAGTFTPVGGGIALSTYYTSWIVRRTIRISKKGKVTVSTNY